MSKILHIAPDAKFINAGHYIFEKAFPNCNHFIIWVANRTKTLSHVDQFENIEVVTTESQSIKEITARIKNFDCIILHGISVFNSRIFLQAEQKNKFIGVLHGAEFYNRKHIADQVIFGNLTSKIHTKFYRKNIVQSIKTLLWNFNVTRVLLKLNDIQKAAKRLDFVASQYKEEIDHFIEMGVIAENSKFIPFTYYPLEFIMKGQEDAIISRNDIFIGNSASTTNNHLECFDLLSNFDIKNRAIVVPLSYGNTLYADYIEAQGKQQFENFTALRSYLSLKEYNEIIQRCGIVIMNHFRQQAVGNIIAALWLGAKVYLNETNTVYKYLKRIGILVFSIQKDLNPTNKYALINLSELEIQNNKAILYKEINEDHIINYLKLHIEKHFS